MITSTQILILIILGSIFLYCIIDRICRCVENVKNPIKDLQSFMSFLKNVNNEDGNKSV